MFISYLYYVYLSMKNSEIFTFNLGPNIKYNQYFTIFRSKFTFHFTMNISDSSVVSDSTSECYC